MLILTSLLLCIPTFLVDGVKDLLSESKTESSEPSLKKVSLAHLMANDNKKQTLADLIAFNRQKEKQKPRADQKGNTLAELFKNEDIKEEEIDEFLEEMRENEQLIGIVFEQNFQPNEQMYTTVDILEVAGNIKFELAKNIDKLLPKETTIDQTTGECPICLSAIKSDDEHRTLTCQHKFHAACIDLWFQKHFNCPYCRAEIFVISYGKVTLKQAQKQQQPNNQ
ncbi:hypothetical protein niasHT_027225 [Heterodera trifolii]|uniref:RING-type domain-containing protein n=1 Tax=Heterodera trifolii TaxID=157864 RepID=A0ABD2JGG3_9BILA